jgi:hypothetical protein
MKKSDYNYDFSHDKPWDSDLDSLSESVKQLIRELKCMDLVQRCINYANTRVLKNFTLRLEMD